MDGCNTPEDDLDATPGLRVPGQRREYDDRFDAFFRETYRALVKVVMYTGASMHDAEDAASQAMTEAYLSWPLLDNPAAWVRKVAIRIHITAAKRSRMGLQLEARVGRMSFLDRIMPEDGDEADEDAGVMAVLLRLPPAQREVMALTFDGYEPAKIAELLGKAAETVRANLREARRKLRIYLADSMTGARPVGGEKEEI